MTVVTLATMRLFCAARINGAVIHTCSYHFNVKPSQTIFSREVLKHYPTNISDVRYRNTRTAAVQPRNTFRGRSSPDRAAGRRHFELASDGDMVVGSRIQRPRRS